MCWNACLNISLLIHGVVIESESWSGLRTRNDLSSYYVYAVFNTCFVLIALPKPLSFGYGLLCISFTKYRMPV